MYITYITCRRLSNKYTTCITLPGGKSEEGRVILDLVQLAHQDVCEGTVLHHDGDLLEEVLVRQGLVPQHNCKEMKLDNSSDKKCLMSVKRFSPKQVVKPFSFYSRAVKSLSSLYSSKAARLNLKARIHRFPSFVLRGSENMIIDNSSKL